MPMDNKKKKKEEEQQLPRLNNSATTTLGSGSADENRRKEAKLPSTSIADVVQNKTKSVPVNEKTETPKWKTVDERKAELRNDKTFQRDLKNVQTNIKRVEQEKAIERRESKIPSLAKQETPDKISTWLDSSYKLSKDEEKEAKQMTSDYFKSMPIVDATDFGTDYVENPVWAEAQAKKNWESLTPEQQAEYKKMQALENKTSNAYSFARGMADTFYPVNMYINYKEANADIPQGMSSKEQGESAKLQNHLSNIAGNLVGNTTQYSLANAALSGIKAFDVAGNALSKIPVLGKLGSETLSNLARGQAADTVIQTLPKAIEDYSEGKSASEIAKNAAKDEGINFLWNLAPDLIGKAASKLLKGKKTETITNAVKDNSNSSSKEVIKEGTEQIPSIAKNSSAEIESIDNGVKNSIPDDMPNIPDGNVVKKQSGFDPDMQEITLDNVQDVSKPLTQEANILPQEEIKPVGTSQNDVPIGENRHNTINNPENDVINADRLVDNGQKVSKTADTIKNSNEVTDTEYLSRYGGDSAFKYKEKSEEYTMQKAHEYLKAKGDDVAFSELMNSERAYTGEDVDSVMQLREKLINQARNTSDVNESNELWSRASKLRRRMQLESSNDAQVLRHLQKWARNTPEGAFDYAVAQVAHEIDKGKVKGYSAAISNLADQADDILKNAASTEEAVEQIQGLFKLDLQRFASPSTAGNFKGFKQAEGGQMVMDFVTDGLKKGKTTAELSEGVRKIINKENGVSTLTTADEKKIYNLLKQSFEAGSESRKGRKYIANAMKIIDNSTPNKLSDSVKSLIYDNMLASIKTMITRNTGGNLGSNTLETLSKPFQVAADVIASPFTKSRTQTLSANAAKEGAKGFGKGVLDWGYDIANGVNTTRSGMDGLDEARDLMRSSFKSNTNSKVANGFIKVLNGYDKAIRKGMELGDRPFYEAAYNSTQAELKDVIKKFGSDGLRKGLPDAANLSDDELIKLISTNAGLEAVMQNNSGTKDAMKKFKQALGSLSKDAVGVDVLSTSNMPFVEVPGNMLSRYLQYTPIGTVGNVARSIGEKAKYGAVNQRRMTTEAGRNALGMLLTGGALGLANNGYISDEYSNDADERKAQQNAGFLEHALQYTDDNGNVQQYDLSDIPILGPKLEEGKILNDSLKENGVDVNDFANKGILSTLEDSGKDIVNGVKEGILPSLQAGMGDALFEGLNRLTGSSNSYSSSNGGLLDNVFNGLKGTASTAYLPSIVRQIGQFNDDYKRDLGDYGTDEYYKNYAEYSNPFTRQNLPIKYNTAGEPVYQDNNKQGLEKAFDTFLAPFTHSNYTEAMPELNKEATRINEATDGEVNPQLIVIKKSDLTGTKGYEDYSHEDLYNLQKEVYTRNNEAGQYLVDSDFYKGLDDASKGQMLNDLYSASKALGKENAVRKGKTEEEIANSDLYTSDNKLVPYLRDGDYEGAVNFLKDKYEKAKGNELAQEHGFTSGEKMEVAQSVLGDTTAVDAYADFTNELKSQKEAAREPGDTKSVSLNDDDYINALKSNNDLSDADKGNYLITKKGGVENLGEKALEAYNKNGSAGLWKYYSDKSDGSGKEISKGQQNVENYFSNNVPSLNRYNALDTAYQSYSSKKGEEGNLTSAKRADYIPFLKSQNVSASEGGDVIIARKGGVDGLSKSDQEIYNAYGKEGLYQNYVINVDADVSGDGKASKESELIPYLAKQNMSADEKNAIVQFMFPKNKKRYF